MKSSEALEKVKMQLDCLENYWLNECVEIIEDDLKILGILKKKKVNIAYLLFVIGSTDELMTNTPFERYNSYFKKCELTQDEFDLIKDWIERE